MRQLAIHASILSASYNLPLPLPLGEGWGEGCAPRDNVCPAEILGPLSRKAGEGPEDGALVDPQPQTRYTD